MAPDGDVQNERGEDAASPSGSAGPTDLPAFLDAVTDGIIVVDPEWRFTHVNRRAVEILGQDPTGLFGREIWDVAPEARGTRFYDECHRAMREGVSLRFEDFNPALQTWFENRLYPSPAGLAILFTDITERKRAQEEIRRLNEELQRRLEECEATSRQLETVLEQMPAAVITAEAPSGRVVYANEEAKRLWALPEPGPERLEEYGDFAGFRPDGRRLTSEEWPLARAILRGESVEGEAIEIQLPDGERRVVRVSAAPIRNADARILGGVVTSYDVTGERRAEERERFLADATRILHSTLDYRTTLDQVARLALAQLADFAYVDLVDEAGMIQRIAAAHQDPEQDALLQEFRDRFAPDWNSPAPAARVLRTGQAELLPEITDEVIGARTTSVEHFEFIRRLGIRSHISVPLAARGRTLGAISFARTAGSPRYQAADLLFAEELARRAALAIDNAQLYNRSQQSAEALQRSEERYRWLVENTTEAVWRFELEVPVPVDLPADRQIELFYRHAFLAECNEGMARMYGFNAPEELVGIRLEQIMPAADAENLAYLRAFIASGYRLVDAESVERDRHGRTKYLLNNLVGHVEDGRILRAWGTSRDVTERKRSEQKLQLLAEASRLLASSLLDEEAMGRFAALTLPLLADFCVFDVLSEEDQLRRIAGAHGDPAKRAVFEEALALRSPTIHPGHPVARALQTGETQVFTGITDAWIDEVATGPQHREVIRELEIGSLLTVPLRTQERTLGALTFCFEARSGRSHTPEDVELAEELASRAAIAVDNARLYRQAVDAEAALRDSEEQFRTLVEQSPLSVQILSPDGWTLQVNRAWESLWGVTADALRDYNMLRDEQLEELGIMPYIRRGFDGEATAIPPVIYDRQRTLPHVETSDQPERWVRAFIYPVRDQAGAIQKVILIHEDFTERKQLEEELQRRVEALAEADRQKDEFLAMLAHELRNPLAPILNAAEILQARGPQDPLLTRQRAIISRQGRHMARLLDDLLDVSRITRGKIVLRPEVLDLSGVVDQAVEGCRGALEQRQQRLVLSQPPEPLPVHVDATRMEQVISNLLRNAAKYSEPGDEIFLTVEREGETAVLRVRDTGIGIAPELLPRIFDLFTQGDRSLARSEGGLGIGLTMVQRLVEMHGGTVEAHSEGLGRGAELVVRLPLAAAEAAAGGTPQPTRAGAPAAERRKRVLIIEDIPDSAETLLELVEHWGYEARTAADGPLGLQIARTYRPELILVDIGLPGMDGYEVARKLREEPALAGVVLVALTGYGQDEDRRRAAEAGFDHHLTKPVDLDTLQELLAGGS